MDGFHTTPSPHAAAGPLMRTRLSGCFFFSPSVVPEAGPHACFRAQDRIGGCVAAGRFVDDFSCSLFSCPSAHACGLDLEAPSWMRSIEGLNGHAGRIGHQGTPPKQGAPWREGQPGKCTGRGRGRPSWRGLSRATSCRMGGSSNQARALQFRRTRPSGWNRAALVRPPPVISRLHLQMSRINTQHAHATFERRYES